MHKGDICRAAVLFLRGVPWPPNCCVCHTSPAPRTPVGGHVTNHFSIRVWCRVCFSTALANIQWVCMHAGGFYFDLDLEARLPLQAFVLPTVRSMNPWPPSRAPAWTSALSAATWDVWVTRTSILCYLPRTAFNG